MPVPQEIKSVVEQAGQPVLKKTYWEWCQMCDRPNLTFCGGCPTS
ncbi:MULTISPECIES: hypothetical protein [unclassified Microcoleus]|nr:MULTISPECIES: hypothetical protein [unclassified Microcoleus]